jgi:hypothetical protein
MQIAYLVEDLIMEQTMGTTMEQIQEQTRIMEQEVAVAQVQVMVTQTILTIVNQQLTTLAMMI